MATLIIPIKFYRYYFDGIDAPLEFEATNKASARQMLSIRLEKLPAYANKNIVQETITRPVTGVTKKQVGDKKFIWVGYDKSHNGWEEIQ